MPAISPLSKLIVTGGRRVAGLPASLLAKFLFLWTGKYDGDDLLSDIDSSVITVTDKDWTGKIIPPDTSATFAVPDNATYLAADGTDDWWFNGAGVLQQKTHADLIISTTMRTFIKYSDFEPYDVSAIGILKDGEVITEAEKVILNKFFKLWVQYWGEEMMASGYMKDNRTFIESILYGLLYNWYAANDPRNITSNGWHVPTQTEYNTLFTYIGGKTDTANKLKEIGTVYWASPNTGATNEFNFNLRGSGYRQPSSGAYGSIKNETDLWTSTEFGGFGTYVLVYTSDNDIWAPLNMAKVAGNPLRIIKDSTTLVHGETGTYIGNNGRTYRTICIGTQEWLADNLVETKYRNGDDIPEVTGNAAWVALTTGALCAYNNDWGNVLG